MAKQKSYVKQARATVAAEIAKRHARAGVVLESALKEQLTAYGLVDRGHLRANQTHSADATSVRAGTNVPYGPPVAFGWDREGADGKTISWRPPGNYMIDGTMRAVPRLRRVYSGEL